MVSAKSDSQEPNSLHYIRLLVVMEHIIEVKQYIVVHVGLLTSVFVIHNTKTF